MDSSARKISVVVPAYNKGQVLFSALESLVRELSLITQNFEVIVVNDGSEDNTLEQALRFKRFNGHSEKIKIYHYPMNVGKGFALSYGFAKTTGDPIFFADADSDISFRNLRMALAYFDQYKADIIVGSKRHPKSQVQYPLIRRFYSTLYQAVIRFLFNLNVKDTQVGLKVFKRQVLEDVLPRLVVKAFAFDLELLVVARYLGYRKIAEAPVFINHGGVSSSINLTAVKGIVMDTLGIFYRKVFLRYYDQRTLLSPQSNLGLVKKIQSTTA
ncbi:hypothetical protein A2Z23_00630 [Candidatus Curtissbacteria bacterium RBG_16_39_7]|uniref:Glycosyltransferase 2-like domain-containing protein n=1 Tax=Candidatus Curtissbacteria bacterium RBG_16_39_7 TaxID=1797707 RepID=A0A1F5G3R2_9BACT|nr:MAG: hypothetical protein A2Z23_00630 [Candidatus Curtissbacteria bacterium RBG_16_39_7]